MSDNLTTSKLIADLWQRNRPLMLERLAQLDRAGESARSGTLTLEDRNEAESTAHKLSGSLGMFGYQQGTEYARELESELQSTQPDATRLIRLAASLRESLGMPGNA